MTCFKASRGAHGIAISGFGQADDIARSKRVGFLKHFTKPVDLGALKAAVQEFSTPVAS